MPQKPPRARLEAKTRKILTVLNEIKELGDRHEFEKNDIQQVHTAIQHRLDEITRHLECGPWEFKL